MDAQWDLGLQLATPLKCLGVLEPLPSEYMMHSMIRRVVAPTRTQCAKGPRQLDLLWTHLR